MENLKNYGWVRLHRKIENNFLWFLEPFTKAQAWIDLFLNANHKDGIIQIRGNILKIKRGQIGWSELTMCKRWMWSKNKTRRFLKLLETEQQIEQQKTSITTIITILNYEKHQADDTTETTLLRLCSEIAPRLPKNDTTEKYPYKAKNKDNQAIRDTTDDTTERQQKDSRRYTNKNVKNDKYISKDIYVTHTSLEEKKEYGNPIINHSIEYLVLQIGQLDRSIQQNRRFCYLLIGKLKKDFPQEGDEKIEQYIKKIIDLAMADPFHKKNTTNFQYLFNNYKKITM